MSVTHLAGLRVIIEHRVIQRCAICGDKLVDNFVCPMSVRADGTPYTIGTWEDGCLVQVTEGIQTRYTGAEILPPDFCLELVEKP